MKLYTEEQVNELRRALRDVAQWDDFLEDEWEDAGNRAMDALRCFNKLTPIQLPSDEDIEKQSKLIPELFSKLSFEAGAKFVIDKMQGGKQ